MSGGLAPRILNYGTIWRWVADSSPGRFTSRGSTAGTHWLGGWVGSRLGSDVEAKRKTHMMMVKLLSPKP